MGHGVAVGRSRLLGLPAADAVQQTALLWPFGRLIANTAMHPGNLSLRPQSLPARMARSVRARCSSAGAVRRRYAHQR